MGGMQGNMSQDVGGFHKSPALMSGASSGQMSTGNMMELPQSTLMSNAAAASGMHTGNSFADQGQSYPFFKRKENSPQMFNTFSPHH